jgi:hypothetical protein
MEEKMKIEAFIRALDEAEIFENESARDEFMTWLTSTGYFIAPASLNHHSSQTGGLCDHSFAVTQCLMELSHDNSLSWSRPQSPAIIGLFHDICKADDYVCVGCEQGGSVWEWNKNAIFTGHGDKSVLMLAPHLTLTEEEVMCIRWHMGAFDEKENWSRYTAAIHKYPNVLWTHTADMIATHGWGM